jgi:anthranilate synthase/aminodeoxychorismate synthase-like glutamine amidotransferase
VTEGYTVILVIDNYDSFVHNLARYLRQLGQWTVVARNDAIDVARIARHPPRAIVLSPGPCGPEQAGCCLDLVRAVWERVPLLGVCLGHQVIAAAFGATVRRAHEPMHGRASPIFHHGTGLFHGLPDPFPAARYHSLVVDEPTLPVQLPVTARTADGTVMAIEHDRYPVFGWQFHPESVLTPHGYRLLAAFLTHCGLMRTGSRPDFGPADLLARPTGPADWYEQPIELT